MHIDIVRVDQTDKGIFGKLTLKWGTASYEVLNLVTLERHDIAIPVGTYKIKMYNSPDHKCMVPLLLDVPGKNYIEMHWGNWEWDSKGCILVGMVRDGDAIDNSKTAFDLLMSKLKGSNDMDVTIK